MNRDALTLLGCSSSLAFILLTSHAANAGTLAPESVGFVGTKSTIAQTVNAPLSSEYPQSASIDPMSDTIGDLAVAKFGCDCMSCRNQVLSMVQSGTLTLPQ